MPATVERDRDGDAGVQQAKDEQWSGTLAESRKEVIDGQRLAAVDRAAAEHQSAHEDRKQHLAGEMPDHRDQRPGPCSATNRITTISTHTPIEGTNRRQASPHQDAPFPAATRAGRQRRRCAGPAGGTVWDGKGLAMVVSLGGATGLDRPPRRGNHSTTGRSGSLCTVKGLILARASHIISTRQRRVLTRHLYGCERSARPWRDPSC